MVITRKEKTLIFILILVLLVGGTFVLGIKPKSDKKKELEEQIKSVIAEKEAANDKVTNNNSQYKKLEQQIPENEAALALLTDPTNDANEEVQSGSEIGQYDAVSVKEFINNYFAENGIEATISTISTVESAGKIVYSFSTGFTCQSTQILFDFVDLVARRMSFSITRLSYNVTEGSVAGTMGFSITYLP